MIDRDMPSALTIAASPPKGSKPAVPKRALSRARSGAEDATTSAAALKALFPDTGFALAVLDAMMPFGKTSLTFDYDAWIAAGLHAGTLTVGESEEDDAIVEWKNENELDLHLLLEKALLALPVPPQALARVKKLDVVAVPKKIMRKFCPQWDGESALGGATTLHGVQHLPNLTHLTVSTMTNIDALTEAPALEHVRFFRYDQSGSSAETGTHDRVLAVLEARGVVIDRR